MDDRIPWGADMNSSLFSFVMFLFYTGLAVTILIIAPYYAPERLRVFKDNELFGYLAVCFAIWKLVQWWTRRYDAKQRGEQKAMEEAYRVRTNPKPAENTKPIVHPEFQFDGQPSPPHQNGTV